MSIALEVIVASVGDAVAAERGGAARLELVADLARGGLTPPLSLVEAVLAAVQVPVRVMIREGESHQVSDPAARVRLVEQAAAVGRHAVDGVVFGAVAGGRVDLALLDAVWTAAARPVTFHRAFESLDDPVRSARVLAAHPGVDRILCDGGPGEWSDRAARLAAWSAAAGDGLIVMPGGGLTAEGIVALAREPWVRELHVGRLVRDPATAEGPVSARLVAELAGRIARLRPVT